MTSKVLHALTSLICELERYQTIEAATEAVKTPGLVADYYRTVKETEGSAPVMHWLYCQLKGHINARALAAQGTTATAANNNQNGSKPDANHAATATANPQPAVR